MACHGKYTDFGVYDDLADEHDLDPQWLRERHEQELDECPHWGSSREHVEFLIDDREMQAEERLLSSGISWDGGEDW